MPPRPGPYRRPYWDTQPPYRFDPYGSTQLRAPSQPLIALPQSISELTGPTFGPEFVRDGDNDLTAGHGGEPIGERILVTGRVLDENGRPVPHALIEIWQANAAGRYVHKRDQHDAPLDPNFTGDGRTLTDARGPLPVQDRSSRVPTRGAIITTRGVRSTFTFRCSAMPTPRAWSRRCISPATRCSRSTRSSTACPMPRRATA